MYYFVAGTIYQSREPNSILLSRSRVIAFEWDEKNSNYVSAIHSAEQYTTRVVKTLYIHIIRRPLYTYLGVILKN